MTTTAKWPSIKKYEKVNKIKLGFAVDGGNAVFISKTNLKFYNFASFLSIIKYKKIKLWYFPFIIIINCLINKLN